MIEIFFILALLFGVFILFYRQAIDQYNILQIEGTQLSDLPKLLSERTPVVVRGVGAPKLFTPETLNGNPRLLTYPVTSQMTLGSYLQNPYNEKDGYRRFDAVAMVRKLQAQLIVRHERREPRQEFQVRSNR